MADELALVPVEPDDAMVEATHRELTRGFDDPFLARICKAHAAMLSAVPARYALIREKELAVIEAAKFVSEAAIRQDAGRWMLDALDKLDAALDALRQAKGTETVMTPSSALRSKAAYG